LAAKCKAKTPRERPFNKKPHRTAAVHVDRRTSLAADAVNNHNGAPLLQMHAAFPQGRRDVLLIWPGMRTAANSHSDKQDTFSFPLKKNQRPLNPIQLEQDACRKNVFKH